MQAVVIGAGLVGSLWSIFLSRRGYAVDVYERRADMRAAGYVGGRSINLALSHRGWRGLERAGIADEIRKVAIPMYGRTMHAPDGGLTYQPYGKERDAIYSVSRGGLNCALLDLVEQQPNVRLHFSHRCDDFRPDTGAIHFTDETNGSTSTITPPLTFATDGAFSAVRSALQKRPRFNYSQDFLDYGYKELTIPARANGGYLLEPNALHIWPRGRFMMIALPNTDGSFTCTLFMPYDGTDSLAHLTTSEAIEAFFELHFADAKALMPDLLAEFEANPTGALVTVRCRPWSFRNAHTKVLMLGDASHAIVPFFGQGMNAGFEDCTVLDDLLTAHHGNWETAFDAFDASRPADADGIANLALRNFVEMRDRVADPDFLLTQKIGAWLHHRHPKAFVPLYSMVTFSHIPYSEAWAEAGKQDALFERILALPNVREEPFSKEVEAVFLEHYHS